MVKLQDQLRGLVQAEKSMKEVDKVSAELVKKAPQDGCKPGVLL